MKKLIFLRSAIINIEVINMFKNFSDWMQNTANVLFDDTKNDLRALPKTVRLQILILKALMIVIYQQLYVVVNLILLDKPMWA